MKFKKIDIKKIQSIRWNKFLVHSNWSAVFNSIRQEDNFYRRRGLVELLETYVNQDEILEFLDYGPITDSYLNTGKFFLMLVRTLNKSFSKC